MTFAKTSLRVLGNCEIFRGGASMIYTEYLRNVSANDNIYLPFRKPRGIAEIVKRIFMKR